MKKIELPLKTAHFEAVLVTHQYDPADLDVMARPPELPDSFLMIGPIGGPLARVDPAEARLLRHLLDELSFPHGQLARMPPPFCRNHG